jgi:hypothetical protein
MEFSEHTGGGEAGIQLRLEPPELAGLPGALVCTENLIRIDC